MIAYIKSYPDVRAMIFEKADRMTRNYADLVRMYDLIEKHDKEIHFFKENFHLDRQSKSSEKLRLDIQVVLARNYINNLSEEVMKGMSQKVKNGGFPSIAPTGYLNRIETREIIVDPKQGPLVRRLFEIYATCRYSLEEVSKIGMKEGLEHPLKRRPIKKSGIYHILLNPFYYGLVVWHDQAVIGKHEPLISKALYDRVQEVLSSLKRPKSRRFAFRGLAECGHCGSTITGEFHRKRQQNGTVREYTYYRCTGWRNGGKVCAGSHISEKDLVAQLGQPLKDLTIDVSVLSKIKAALTESFKGEKEFHGNRVAALQSESTKLKNWVDKAYTDRLDGLISTEDYREKSEAWRNRLFAVQNEIRAHQTADSTYLKEGERIFDLTQRAYALYEKQPDFYEKRKLIDSMISKVVVKDRQALLNLREPFHSLSKLALAAKSKSRGLEWWAVEDLNL